MVEFTTTILKFANQGEKTGWTYIIVPEKAALQLKPGNKKSFRVKGRLDLYPVQSVALLPKGNGDFIMAFNAAMRKATGKRQGAALKVQLQADDKPMVLNKEMIDCLADEPAAMAYFNALPASHQRYYSNWIESGKTDATRTRRISYAVSGLAKKMDFAAILRSMKDRQDTGD